MMELALGLALGLGLGRGLRLALRLALGLGPRDGRQKLDCCLAQASLVVGVVPLTLLRRLVILWHMR
jgi:hypothetical protein